MHGKYERIGEKEIVQGFLLHIAKKEIQQHKTHKKVFLIAAIIGVFVDSSIIKSFYIELIRGSDFFSNVLWMLLIAFITFITMMFIICCYMEVCEKSASIFKHAIYRGDIYFKKVKLVAADNGSGDGWSTDYYAEIVDENGILHKEKYPFFFKEKYEVGEAIYIEVPLTETKVKRIVIPGRSESIQTWECGLEAYQKYLMNREDKK